MCVCCYEVFTIHNICPPESSASSTCPYALSSSGSLIIHRTSQKHWGILGLCARCWRKLGNADLPMRPGNTNPMCFSHGSLQRVQLCGKLSCFTLAQVWIFCPEDITKNGTLNLVFSAPIYIRHMILRKKHGKQANRHLISVKRSFCLQGSKSLQYPLAQINAVYIIYFSKCIKKLA